MFNLSSSVKIFVFTKPVDMRCSFNGLFALTQNQLQQNPYTGHLFLFRSRRGDFLKVFWWDVDGFAIFAKRLEVGTFQFPPVRFVDGAYQPVEIERSQLMLMLEGIDPDSVKRHKRYRENPIKAPAQPLHGSGHHKTGLHFAEMDRFSHTPK
jgi:transposase